MAGSDEAEAKFLRAVLPIMESPLRSLYQFRSGYIEGDGGEQKLRLVVKLQQKKFGMVKENNIHPRKGHKAQRWSRDIAIFFLKLCPRLTWVFKAALWSLVKTQSILHMNAEQAPEPVWTCAENFVPHWDLFPRTSNPQRVAILTQLSRRTVFSVRQWISVATSVRLSLLCVENSVCTVRLTAHFLTSLFTPDLVFYSDDRR